MEPTAAEAEAKVTVKGDTGTGSDTTPPAVGPAVSAEAAAAADGGGTDPLSPAVASCTGAAVGTHPWRFYFFFFLFFCFRELQCNYLYGMYSYYGYGFIGYLL